MEAALQYAAFSFSGTNFFVLKTAVIAALFTQYLSDDNKLKKARNLQLNYFYYFLEWAKVWVYYENKDQD